MREEVSSTSWFKIPHAYSTLALSQSLAHKYIPVQNYLHASTSLSQSCAPREVRNEATNFPSFFLLFCLSFCVTFVLLLLIHLSLRQHANTRLLLLHTSFITKGRSLLLSSRANFLILSLILSLISYVVAKELINPEKRRRVLSHRRRQRQRQKTRENTTIRL